MDSQEKGRSFPSVLIDTPIWQNYFRRKEPTYQQVNMLMDAGRACCLGFIVAELLYSAETKEEIKVFRDFMRIFPILQAEPGQEAWLEAAHLAFRLRGKGKNLSLRDCYLAVMAKSNDALLYTTSLDLKDARRMMGLKLFAEGERV